MEWKALKYLATYTLPLAVYLSFTREGWVTFLPIAYGFGVIPLLELIIGSSTDQRLEFEKEVRRSDRIYDLLIWLILPVQVTFLIWYLFNIQSVEAFTLTWWGRTVAMGMMCGVFGINVAHELGHRTTAGEKLVSKVLLMTSLYPHFHIEHNYGHHKHVATQEDPASARYNESLYGFWARSIWHSYWSAWKIENQRLKRAKKSVWTLHNEMLIYTIVELVLLAAVFWFFGPVVVLGFVIASAIGILLLETVNYIEHYGLQRQKLTEHRYENTAPEHSWNSNHIIGRVFLFELSRHSDHHANPSKKYQNLGSPEDSPQMPTGYPGMMLLSTIPPLWFRVMNPRVNRFQTTV